MKEIIAIIPARGGSKGIPGKNIKMLGGFPLIAYSIIAAKLCKSISRTIVSTDSQEIAEISKKYGAEVPFLRPKELSTDKSPDSGFVLHAINWFEKNEGKVPEYFVHLRPTTPLRDPLLIDDAIKILKNSPAATSLRSGHEATESPFKWFMTDERGFFVPFSSPDGKDYSNMPRQMCPKVYIPDGYVDVLKSQITIHKESIHGSYICGYISPFCIEIDSQKDFDLLEYELDRKGSVILSYLSKFYHRAFSS